jgi:predicted lipoprotein with Yx(FWY)xxD motif
MHDLKVAVAAVCAGLVSALAPYPTVAAVENALGTPASPAGITFTPVQPQGRGMAYGRGGGAPSGVLSDAANMTLYTYDGEAPCVADCLTEWKPALASDRAVETAEWTVVGQPEGTNQWAYYGKPLFTSAKDEKPGDINGQTEEGDWHVATYKLPDGSFLAPSGISIKPSARAKGDVLVNHVGKTLYYLADTQREACGGTCLESWIPLVAGELAGSFGDWAVENRPDGIRQWAFQGQALYTFTGDKEIGDAEGLHFDNRWRTAAVRAYFIPENVQMRKMSHFEFFTTRDGQTIYTRDRYQYTAGSFHADGGSTAKVSVGRKIGTDACDGPCEDVWVPFTAGAEDQPSGYWSIVKRDDGTRQWAYQGYALYTHTSDKNPGDMFGRDEFEFTDGSSALYWRVAIP